jgi:hypothetical protein
MQLAELKTVRSDLTHAISAIQSDWSPRERARRQRLAEQRQHRLAQMLSPQPRLEAYDCQCDLGGSFQADDAREPAESRRAQRYVLVGD